MKTRRVWTKSTILYSIQWPCEGASAMSYSSFKAFVVRDRLLRELRQGCDDVDLQLAHGVSTVVQGDTMQLVDAVGLVVGHEGFVVRGNSRGRRGHPERLAVTVPADALQR